MGCNASNPPKKTGNQNGSNESRDNEPTQTPNDAPDSKSSAPELREVKDRGCDAMNDAEIDTQREALESKVSKELPAECTRDVTLESKQNVDKSAVAVEEESVKKEESVGDKITQKQKYHATDRTMPPRMEEGSAVDEQERFNTALRCACEIFRADSVLQHATSRVSSLALHKSLPPTMRLSKLLHKLPNLQEVDISGNNLGPHGFRAIILGLCHNTSITSLNISNNMADTDSSECIGKMLSTNRCLEVLDVSGNHLGKDYFSRCVGPALNANNTLQILRCESIGATDLLVLTENLSKNTTLLELNISHNDLLKSTQSMQNISNWLQFNKCGLANLILKNCGLKDCDLSLLTESLKSNLSLSTLNVSSNKTEETTRLLDLLLCVVIHPNIRSFTADDIQCTAAKRTWEPKLGPITIKSKLTTLSLSGCKLRDQHVDGLRMFLGNGSLPALADLNLSKNPDLTLKGLSAFIDFTQGGSSSNLKRLSWGLNGADGIAELLNNKTDGLQLDYLNIRRAKLNASEIGKLSCIVTKTDTNSGLQTLVLDGIKLSGYNVLAELFVSGVDCSLVAVSLSGCSLADQDVEPIAAAIERNIPLTMLKLSANRLTDRAVSSLVDALLIHPQHSLQLIDFMNNKIEDTSAKKLSELFTSRAHNTRIHSLNLSNNNIGSEGVSALVSLVHQTCLTSLQVSNQQCQYEEEDVDLIVTSLVKALGLDIGEKRGKALTECFNLPKFKSSVSVRLTGLGGNAGEFGGKIDCTAFPTDIKDKMLPHLSFNDALEIAASFKGLDKDRERCCLSQEEWVMVTSANKESPSWLQLQENRDSCIYLSHLPAAITVQKMEAVLDMEADCSVEEIFLLKDPVFRKNTGFAWVLLRDADNVKKAVQFMNNAQAQVFSKAFMISEVQVEITNESGRKQDDSAREELRERLKARKAEEAKHRALIRKSYLESQARHAYRLAHPAYADGRIW